MTFLMFFGGLIFFTESFNLVHSPSQDAEAPESVKWDGNRKQLDTVCFHTFILMNLFNSINCRLVDSKEATQMNVFRTLFNNPTYWTILAVELVIQDIMIRAGDWGLGSAIVGTKGLT